jgi:hypothetical protein
MVLALVLGDRQIVDAGEPCGNTIAGERSCSHLT